MTWELKKFFGKQSAAAEEEKPVEQEKLMRELSIHANQRPTGRTFNKKLIYGLLMLFVISFACALMFGMTDKKKTKQEEIETQTTKGEHLANVPKKYSDVPNKTEQTKKPPLKEPSPPPVYTTPAPTPTYTPIPQPRTGQVAPAPIQKSGLSQEEKIQLERAKEKIAANKSPIRFSSIGEEEKTNEKNDKKN